MARVAHLMDACFPRTQTFVYDFVTGCNRYEAWCLARHTMNEEDFPFPRIMKVGIRWESCWPLDLADRALYRLYPDHGFPLYRALRSLRPAIAHAHFADVGYESLHVVRRLRIPLITSFYGFDASALPMRDGWLDKLQRLFSAGAAFIAEGPTMRSRLIELGCEARKVLVVPISLHLRRYSFVPRRLEKGEMLRLLFVGRFVPKKGLDVLLSSLSLVGKALGDWRLTVIGGPDIDAVRAVCVRLGIASRCIFAGVVARVKMIEEMRNAHVLVVPSVTAPDGDTEGGAPTVLLEAQALGLPVVGTRHADIPYVVAAEYDEFLCAEGCATGLAGSLVKIRESASRWEAMGHAGRRHIERQHGAGNFETLQDIYDQAHVGEQQVSLCAANTDG